MVKFTSRNAKTSDQQKNQSGQRRGLTPAARTVILVGFMGAGKSSVGRALGRRLGWPFQDLDERIQAQEGRTIDQIFREAGEDEFRRLEHVALRDLIQSPASATGILALGGGAYVQQQNSALLEQLNIPVVFLDAPVEELFRRCEQDPVERPLRRDLEQFRELYQSRRPSYLKANWRISTGGKDIEAVAAEVAVSLGLQE